MATTAESGGGDVLRSERIAGGILPPVLNTFDMVAIFVAIVLFISNSAILAGGAGSSAYFYWVLGFITFLIPGAIVTGQLGACSPVKAPSMSGPTRPLARSWASSRASVRGGQAF